MKAVVIENEYDVDNTIKALLKDNPELFEKVYEMTHAQSRGRESIISKVLECEAIIVASTWMYMDQVLEYLDAFLTDKFPVKSLYIHHVTERLNEWKHAKSWEHEELESFEKVKQLMNKGFKLYDFREDPDRTDKIMDGLNKIQSMFIDTDEEETFPRGKTMVFEIHYSPEHDLFYIDHEFYNLQEQINDEIENTKGQ